MNDENPFASPQTVADEGLEKQDSPAEKIRRQYLSHEASVQSIGWLFVWQAVVGSMAATGLIVEAFPPPGTVAPFERMLMIPAGFVVAGIASALFWTGIGLGKLRAKVRMSAIIFSALTLIAIPIGTLFGGYSLYLLLSERGKYILSPEYTRIRAATPHIKYKTSIGTWICLVVLLVMFMLTIGVGIVWFESR